MKRTRWLSLAALLNPACSSKEPIETTLPGPFDRAEVATLADIGDISDMALRSPGPGQPEGLVVAGTHGFAVLDPETGAVRSSTKLSKVPDNWLDVQILDLDGDGEMELLRGANSWVGPTAAYDHTGALLWEAYGDAAPERCLPVDLNGDGKLELLHSFNATDEVALLSHEGKELWRVPWKHPTELLEVDGRVFTIDGEAVAALGPRGKELGRLALGGGYVNALYRVDGFPGVPSPALLVGRQEDTQRYGLYSLSLEPLKEVSWEEALPYTSGRTLSSGGATLRLQIGRLLEQARLAGFSDARLQLQAWQGASLRFEEVLPSPERGMARAEGASLVVDGDWWVGFGDKVWRYRYTP
jgi:hypothetical protein